MGPTGGQSVGRASFNSPVGTDEEPKEFNKTDSVPRWQSMTHQYVTASIRFIAATFSCYVAYFQCIAFHVKH